MQTISRLEVALKQSDVSERLLAIYRARALLNVPYTGPLISNIDVHSKRITREVFRRPGLVRSGAKIAKYGVQETLVVYFKKRGES